MKRVVITGMGVLSPVGSNLDDFWKNIIEGNSGVGPITRFDVTQFPTKIAAEITDWQPSDMFTPREINRRDKLSLYGLKVAGDAIRQSGLDEFDPHRAGVVWASGNGGIETLEQGLLDYATQDGPVRFSPFYVPKSLLDTPSGEIAMAHNFKGINYAVVSACASSNSAIMDALNYIRWDKADVMIAGGSEAAITRAMIGGFGSMKALSRRNDEPKTASRPFDKSRDGFVMGEGAGALVLESLDHALARGATILGEVKGASMNNDAFHPTATHPNGDGAAIAMKLALKDSGLLPDDLQYVNMHATSTNVGDMSEIRAIQQLYPEKILPYLSATKSVTGHLLGAAGAVEAIITVLAIKEGLVPPTMHIQELDPEIPQDVRLVRDNAQLTEIKYAMSNTFGFGGHNAIVIFGKY